MNASRLVALSLLACVGLLLTAAPAAAQELDNQPKDKDKPFLPFELPKTLPLPPDVGGQPISEADRTWAYVVAVGGFLLVFVMTRVAVRVLAYIIIFLLVIGGAGLICALLDEHRITTWPMLLITTASIAGACGVASSVVGLFTIDQDKK